jgi:hypothetical protein
MLFCIGVKLGLSHYGEEFENRMPRRIFGPRREEGAGGWGKLHSEEFHKLYASPNIVRVMKSRRMRLADRVACKREIINGYTILVGKSEVNRPLVRHRHR